MLSGNAPGRAAAGGGVPDPGTAIAWIGEKARKARRPPGDSGATAAPLARGAMRKRQHLLITGIRRPGSPLYRFRIYGHPGNEFPPVEMETSLGGLHRWLRHGDERPEDGGGHLQPLPVP